MAFMAKDKIVRTGDDLNLATLVGLQTNATALNALAADEPALSALADDATVLDNVATAAAGAAFSRVEKVAVVNLTANAGATNGGVLAWANPEGVPIVVTRLLVNISDAAAESETIDFGVAASATTAAANLIEDLDADVAGFFCNIKDGGTGGKAAMPMISTDFLTGTASDALTSFAGKAYIHYVLA
jgi:hypothetical protein